MTLEQEVLSKISNAMKEAELTSKIPVRLQKPPSLELGHFAIMINPLAGKNDPEKYGEKLKQALENQTGIEKADLSVSTDKKGRKQVYLNITLKNDFLSNVIFVSPRDN